MAVITLTPIQLVPGTETLALAANQADNSAVDVVATDTFRIDINGLKKAGIGEARLLIVAVTQSAGASVITFDAGDYPPAALASKGSDTLTLGASETKAMILEAGRHMQNDGYITGSVATTAVYLTAYALPVGY